MIVSIQMSSQDPSLNGKIYIMTWDFVLVSM